MTRQESKWMLDRSATDKDDAALLAPSGKEKREPHIEDIVPVRSRFGGIAILRTATSAARTLGGGLLLSLCLTACSLLEPSHSYRPPKGMVPDEQTAKLIAEAILVPIYGRRQIEEQKPFSVRLENNVWQVWGSFPKPERPDEVVVGGVAEIWIAKKNGAIIKVTHGE
jgi:hypothetical protein